jgi:hypothetical protein
MQPSSQPSVKSLAEQMTASLSLEPAALSRKNDSPRRSTSIAQSSPRLSKSPPEKKIYEQKTSKEAVKKLALPQFPNGNEQAADLVKQKAFYEDCKKIIELKIRKAAEKKSQNDPEVNDARHAYLASLVETLEQIDVILARRQESRDKCHLLAQEAKFMRQMQLKQQERREMKKEVDDLVNHLNDTSPTRKAELEERFKDIHCLVNGIPARGSTETTPLAISLLEIWRIAATTSIVDCGEQVQAIHPHAGNPTVPPDEKDTGERFVRLYTIFQKHSGDATSVPNVTGWVFDTCRKWADSSGPELETSFRNMMKRFVRTANQALLTGILPRLDVMDKAPHPNRIPDCKNKLHAHAAAGTYQIYRVFNIDHTSDIKIILPFNMKTREGLLFSRIIVNYTIKFDSEMNPIAPLTCKASHAIYD